MKLKLFVCEFITGGGLIGRELPENMTKEGDLMLRAVIRDLLDAGYDYLITSRDRRLPKFSDEVKCISIKHAPWKHWKQLLLQADLALIIAPESANILFQLTRLAESCGCTVLGCCSDIVSSVSSKNQCLLKLRENGIKVADSHKVAKVAKKKEKQLLVAKPDIGAGSTDVVLFKTYAEFHTWLKNRRGLSSLRIESYISGIPASLTLFCSVDGPQILAVNRQLFKFKNGVGSFSGVIVNEFYKHRDNYTNLTNKIFQAFPRLRGIIGIDFIITDNGSVVIEINPRLTTAYVGLRESLGYNPAILLPRLIGDVAVLHPVAPTGTPVGVHLMEN